MRTPDPAFRIRTAHEIPADARIYFAPSVDSPAPLVYIGGAARPGFSWASIENAKKYAWSLLRNISRRIALANARPLVEELSLIETTSVLLNAIPATDPRKVYSDGTRAYVATTPGAVTHTEICPLRDAATEPFATMVSFYIAGVAFDELTEELAAIESRL
jgi:hypothetical protein